jgi:hypothetical protein
MNFLAPLKYKDAPFGYPIRQYPLSDRPAFLL